MESQMINGTLLREGKDGSMTYCIPVERLSDVQEWLKGLSVSLEETNKQFPKAMQYIGLDELKANELFVSVTVYRSPSRYEKPQ